VGTRSNAPVFCDQSGVRSVVVQWGFRSVGLLVLLLCAGLALTLETRVDVPGLSRLIPAIEGGSELFDAPARRNGGERQKVDDGKVMVAETRDQTDARVRDLPVPQPTSAPPTAEPAAEHSDVTRVEPMATTPSTASSAQTSPTQKPRPTVRPRNPNAADPGQNPNAQGSAADAPGHALEKAKAKGKGGDAPAPEAGVEPANS
jgi:hypothetical protein